MSLPNFNGSGAFNKKYGGYGSALPSFNTRRLTAGGGGGGSTTFIPFGLAYIPQ